MARPLQPPPDEEDPYLGAHPYLGAGHEYLEKTPGAAPFLGDIHIHNPAGFVSFGWPEGDVPSMKRGIPAIAARISRDLFLADLGRAPPPADRRCRRRFRTGAVQSAVWRGA